MQILGIPLHTPTARALLVMSVMALVTSVIGTVLMVAGLFTVGNVLSLTLGVMGGSLAYAYGVSVKDHGWHGVVIVTGFVFSMLGLAALAAWLA
jgi:hypothetical protein